MIAACIGRHLLERAQERRERPSERLSLDTHLGIDGHQASIRIERVCPDPEGDLRPVRLAGPGQVLDDPRGIADRHRQHTGRHRIERAGMTDFPLARDPANLRHDIMTGESGRLVDDQETVQPGRLAFSDHRLALRVDGLGFDQLGHLLQEFPFGLLATDDRAPGCAGVAAAAEHRTDRRHVDWRQAPHRNAPAVRVLVQNRGDLVPSVPSRKFTIPSDSERRDPHSARSASVISVQITLPVVWTWLSARSQRQTVDGGFMMKSASMTGLGSAPASIRSAAIRMVSGVVPSVRSARVSP